MPQLKNAYKYNATYLIVDVNNRFKNINSIKLMLNSNKEFDTILYYSTHTYQVGMSTEQLVRVWANHIGLSNYII